MAGLLLEPFGGGEGKLIIPFFAEAADQWFAKEFIDVDSFFSAEDFSAFAYLPAMIVHSCHTSYVFKSDWIQTATDGFEKFHSSFAAQTLEKTKTFSSGGIKSENAVLAVDNARDQITFLINIRCALFLGHFLSSRSHEGNKFGKLLVEFVGFLKSEGGAGISFNAAFAKTGVKVALKVAFYDIKRDKSIVDLYQGVKS